jgi:hypothetical protein
LLQKYLKNADAGAHTILNEAIMKLAEAGMAVGVVLVFSAGCGLQTSQVGGTQVETGMSTLASARKFLQGKWTLSSLQVSSAQGKSAPIEATGTLVADEFGNLEIIYRLSDAGRKTMESLGVQVATSVLTTSGQVVIDSTQKSITYVAPDAAAKAFDPALAAARANPFALERPRYYSVDPKGALRLATRYDDGKDAAVGTWTRVP